MLNLPANIFSRIETLKKWQQEQQERLLKQQSEQSSFLNNEQQRLSEALAVSTPKDKSASFSSGLSSPLSVNEDSISNSISATNIEDVPIKSPKKNFNDLLEEKLKQDDVQERTKSETKPKRAFLKKGSGMVRYNLAPTTSKTPKTSNKTGVKPRVRFETPDDKKDKCKVTEGANDNCDKSSWATVLEQQQNDSFKNMLDGSLGQKAFELQLERELQMKRDMEELRLFELLEQKAKNSSFCSTNSTISRLISQQTQCTVSADWSPVRPSSPQSSCSEISTSDSSAFTVSSENDTPVRKHDVAVNTEVPYPNVRNEERVLRDRLGQLEREIETFREENAKSARQRQQTEQEAAAIRACLEEERQKLEDDRKRLAKEKVASNRNITGNNSTITALRRERDDLRVQLTTITEELKVKESRYGAAQARYRIHLRSLEKENATLKNENESLLKQNAKFQATFSMNKRRPPTDTKVLHEINKNLTKLAARDVKKLTTENKENRCISLNDVDVSVGTKRNKTRLSLDDSDTEFKKVNSRVSGLANCDTFEKVRRDYEMVFGGDDAVTKSIAPDMTLPDGSVRTTYPNGNVRTVSKDGGTITMSYYNGDIKETNTSTGTVRYYYKETGTWHTNFGPLDGGPLEVLEFPNGQVEKRRPDGSSEVSFPDGSVTCVSPKGTECTSFTDGTELITDGHSRILTLPNGQREIHTDDHKRREYPDGTVKLLYPDGTQETRYANGRIRIKDTEGRLVMDTESTD